MAMANEASAAAECSALTVRYYHLIDRAKFEEACDLFAENGTFLRGGELIVGPDHLLKALRARPPRQVVRHLVSNLVADGTENEVSTRYDLAVYIRKPDDPPGGVPPMSYMVDCVTEFVRDSKGWRMQRIHTEPIF
jgi:hypothetical protein